MNGNPQIFIKVMDRVTDRVSILLCRLLLSYLVKYREDGNDFVGLVKPNILIVKDFICCTETF